MNKKVPKGWKIGKFSDLAKVTNGYAFQSSDFVEKTSTSLPVIKMNNLKRGHINLSNAVYVKRETVKELEKFLLTRGDFVFGMSGSISNYAVIKKKDGACYQNQRVGRLSSLNSSSEFVSQLFLSESVTQQIKSLAAGGAQVNISSNQIENLEILNPPIEEQKKIGSILTSVDDVIENTQKKIDKLLDLKKATMNELLTKGIDHKEFKDSVLGRIPKSWEVKTLIDVTTNGISNGVFNDPKMQGSGYRLINVYDMYQGFGIDDKQLTKLDISENEFQKNRVKYGDIFLTRSSLKLEGIAHCNICLSNADDITYDGHLMKISPNTLMVEPIFLVLQCLSDYGRIFFMKMAKQSTMTTIGQQDIAQLSIALPALEEQKKIVIVHNSFETKIDGLKFKLNQIQSLKKSLMQVLLTGKVRVKVN